jgi:hypothetical protein
MSSLSEQDHLNPNDPAYYAPRWLRERAESRSSAPHEAISETGRAPASPPASLDTQLENAVSGALWHPLDPEVIHEPAELARELDRRAAVMSVATRFAAAIGVSAVVALFFVIMVPASRQSDAVGSTSGVNTQSASVPSAKTAAPQSGQREDGSNSALADFQTLLASAQASQPATTHEQSEQLLQQFLKWGQKPSSTDATQ